MADVSDMEHVATEAGPRPGTLSAWVPVLLLLCLVLASCSRGYDTRGPVTPSGPQVNGGGADAGGAGLAAIEDVAGQTLIKDLQDSSVRKSKTLFRREYQSALAGLRGSGRADVEERAKRIYQKYIDRIGFNGILNVLEESLCHSEGHPLGKIVYTRLGDLGAAIHLAGDRCTNGVFHGVLMEAFTSGVEHLDLLRIEEGINRVCNTTELAPTQNIGNCAHGVGHAVMYLAGFDIERSMQACKQLAAPQLQYYCATGAFMEYDGVHGKADFEKSFHSPCDTLADFPAACYRYKMYWVVDEMLGRGQGIQDIANECLGLARMARLGCFHGMGLSFLPQIAASPESIAATCGFGDADDQQVCIEGAIEKLADYDEGTALRACGHLDGDNRSVCVAAARDHHFSLDKDFSLYIGDQR